MLLLFHQPKKTKTKTKRAILAFKRNGYKDKKVYNFITDVLFNSIFLTCTTKLSFLWKVANRDNATREKMGLGIVLTNSGQWDF